MNSIAKKILKLDVFQRKAKKEQLSRLIVVEVSIIITKERTGQITLSKKAKQNVMYIKEITEQTMFVQKKRAKRNEYQRKYRANKASLEKRSKGNEYLKNYLANNAIKKFHEIVNQDPLYICTCCDQLWYKHSVLNADKLRKSNCNIHKYLCNMKSVDNKEWVCRTCHSHLINNKIPPCAIANGIKFPDRPDFFDLNELECRLLAPRIAFQKLMQAPRGRQCKIHGNIVNVPADVGNTVTVLPHLQSQTGTVKINLKKKLHYKSSAFSLNARPFKVIHAAQWLINNSALYRDEGIIFNNEWLNNYHAENMHTINADNSLTESIDENRHVNVNSETLDNEYESSEDEEETPAGVTDTMLTATDFLEDNERQNILNVAPAEGSRPLSVFRDKYSEELAYPGIFLGQSRPENKQRKFNINYSDICKSELRRSDRRAAMCIENIFYKTKKLQMKILLGKSHIALRKCKGNNKNISAGQLKQQWALDR